MLEEEIAFKAKKICPPDTEVEFSTIYLGEHTQQALQILNLFTKEAQLDIFMDQPSTDRYADNRRQEIGQDLPRS
jgi:hypothetical protein